MQVFRVRRLSSIGSATYQQCDLGQLNFRVPRFLSLLKMEIIKEIINILSVLKFGMQ